MQQTVDSIEQDRKICRLEEQLLAQQRISSANEQEPLIFEILAPREVKKNHGGSVLYSQIIQSHIQLQERIEKSKNNFFHFFASQFGRRKSRHSFAKSGKSTDVPAKQIKFDGSWPFAVSNSLCLFGNFFDEAFPAREN